MNYWHMQMHPSDENWGGEREVLEKHSLIGMGDWDEGKGQQDAFENVMDIGDIVAIKRGGQLIALTEVIGEYQYEENGLGDDWIKRIRKVKVLDWYKDEYNFNVAPMGTLVRCADLSKETSQSIIKWHDLVNLTKLLEHKHQIILQGPPGTGKTKLAKEIAEKLTKDEDKIKLIQFHPAYSYEDFVRGIVAESKGDKISYVAKDKVLAEFAKKASNDLKAKYILIIDEINRANLPAVLGELIYGLEYRGEKVESMYAIEQGGREITLPEKIYIIGTMNTADRSVGHIDYAIRRRFAFVDVPPNESVITNDKAKALFKKVAELFDKNLSSDFKKEDVQIGHSYFLADDDAELGLKLKYEIKPILHKAFSEHITEDISKEENVTPLTVFFKQDNPSEDKEKKCVWITEGQNGKKIHTHYYVGIDWLIENELAVYVAPKLDDTAKQTDYVKMLFSCLKHPEVAEHTKNLYEIKFDKSLIEIPQNQDLLTPFLVVQFLQLLKAIVRKGLKKSYYKVERNLDARIKGKVLVAQTIKQNVIKNKLTRTFCQYDEFGFNGVENRILKRTLIFVQKYLALFPEFSKLASPIVGYCMPAFHEVDEHIDVRAMRGIFHNSFYKEYKEALRIALLILKRFAFNIKEVETQKDKTVKVQPFWINMSNLFELYVLGLLRDKYSNDIIIFQCKGTYGIPDFLLKGEPKMIIDAKYKRIYQKDNNYEIDDIRQLSGYARDCEIVKKLVCTKDVVIDCLIIYPDQKAEEKLSDNLKNTPICGFTKFYKMPIKLPVQVEK
ncbi:hypothetical protein CHS0354_000630 [Potamilus streckersoni]|uniref:AAA+ ATPase domain-containing protein n=1 Tax=Potamilus streckersoni TaxID=2493646 RepID=A0AAE0W839_9BIVA|nr:hypothetical protein CHS0354_000630 [Potamilus streckersoni]